MARLVIKIGTQALTRKDGLLNKVMLKQLVSQLIALQRKGHELILVSSGAQGAGRALVKHIDLDRLQDRVVEKQLLSSVGQAELIESYKKTLKPYGVVPGQLLLTRKDFESRHHYINIYNLLESMLKEPSVIPIVNENDSVSVRELMFTDNDELASLLAAQVSADRLIIMTCVDGVYDRSPEHPKAKVIPVIDAAKPRTFPSVSPSKSSRGRGGMTTKLGAAKKMAQLGIQTHIVNAKTKGVLQAVLNDEQVGTVIKPVKKQTSIKRWIATGHHTLKGSVIVNSCLTDMLKKRDKAMSLLPVGVVSVEGAFEKGDMVEVKNADDEVLGLGIARYGDKRLGLFLGQKNKPVFIHYDYFYVY